MSGILLETHGLSRYFGGLKAVDNVSLTVRQGTVHAIIGPNGAGKTTLLNVISGVLKPTRGRVLFRGQDITGWPPHRLARLGIGRSFQLTNLFPSLTVLDHVYLALQATENVGRVWWRDHRAYRDLFARAEEILARVGLLQQQHLPAGSLPHGDQRRLELAILLAQDPALMLLDEPTSGLSAEQVPAFMDLVRTIAEEGTKTIVLVEHNMRVVMGLSDIVTVMHQGRILAEGPPEVISEDETVQRAYLGELYGEFADLMQDGP